MEFWTAEMEKQVGARVQILLSNPDLLAVFQRFGASVFRRSSVFHGLGQFLAENGVRGKTCFEIGTWNGLTAIVLSRFFDRVVTVDIANNEIKHQIIAHLGIKNIRCFDIKNNEDKAAVAREFQFDCAYLDGDHANDTPTDFEITRHCGRIVFHEVWPFQKPVWDLVHQALPYQQVVHGGAGLALWDGTK